jgi:hypothetical protein
MLSITRLVIACRLLVAPIGPRTDVGTSTSTSRGCTNQASLIVLVGYVEQLQVMGSSGDVVGGLVQVASLPLIHLQPQMEQELTKPEADSWTVCVM